MKMNNPELNKLPPQAVEAEESVLSAALLGAAVDVAELLSPDDFYRTAHREIHAVITDLVGSNTEVDLTTVVSALRDREQLEKVGGAAYVSRLIDTIPSSTALKDHTKIIKAAAKKRRIIQICNEYSAKCYNGHGVEEILSGIEAETSNIETHSGGFKKIGDLLPGEIERWEQAKTKSGISGIPCGLVDVDRKFGGFQGSTLYVIGARPSMGKSALGMRFGRGAAKEGVPVLFISIEMSSRQVVAREMSCESNVDGERFRSGDISPGQWEKIATAADRIAPLPIWIDDNPTANIKGVQSKIRNFYKTNGNCLIIIDYLQYIKGIASERKDIEIGTITRGLKATCRSLNIPIILLAQLNRNIDTRNEKRPEITDLRGSGEIEQDADIIAFLYRDEVYNPDENNPNRGTAELIVKKFRDGKLGTVFLSWIGYRTTFENLQRV